MISRKVRKALKESIFHQYMRRLSICTFSWILRHSAIESKIKKTIANKSRHISEALLDEKPNKWDRTYPSYPTHEWG